MDYFTLLVKHPILYFQSTINNQAICKFAQLLNPVFI
jgi:hypothetical protein